jgi:hypothetical protein
MLAVIGIIQLGVGEQRRSNRGAQQFAVHGGVA